MFYDEPIQSFCFWGVISKRLCRYFLIYDSVVLWQIKIFNIRQVWNCIELKLNQVWWTCTVVNVEQIMNRANNKHTSCMSFDSGEWKPFPRLSPKCSWISREHCLPRLDILSLYRGNNHSEDGLYISLSSRLLQYR